MADLLLNVNGTKFGGWTRVRVHRSIEEIAGQFEIDCTELWSPETAPRAIAQGDQCSVQIDGQTVVTGFVDKVHVQYDTEQHTITVSGRDATADLVDCSAIYKKGEWANAKLDQIARDLCKPFGISVKVATDVGDAFPKWKIQEGETVYECLERAAKLRGVLLLSDGQGGLILGKPSQTPIGYTLKLGENVKRGEAENDQSKRYSQYIIKGQRAGHDNASGEAVVAQKGTATDPGTKRYRPLVIVCEDQGQIKDFTERAKLEATVRAARSLQAKHTVQGWTYPGGVFAPNGLVHVSDALLGIERDLLIKEVDQILDEQGTRTEISLTIADAYQVLPPKHVKKGKKGKKAKVDAVDLLTADGA